MAPPPTSGFSLWRWLKGLFAQEPAAESRPAREAAPAQQEQRAVDEFCRHFGVRFTDPGVLKLALTHRSYLSVTGLGPRESNERLEFLGDSVLGLVTSEHLYRTHPNEHEGQLTKTKSLLVSKAILSRRALAIGLGRFVLMSHSEIESGGRQRLSILADAFESVLGAIYLDQGFEAARSFIHRHLLDAAGEIVADKRHTNYKSGLQEFVQSTFRTHPVYRIRSEAGPDHSKYFMVEVCVGRRILGEGRGRNKKEAEQAAARNALERVESEGTRSVRRRTDDRGVRVRSAESERGGEDSPRRRDDGEPSRGEEDDSRRAGATRRRRGESGRRATPESATGAAMPADAHRGRGGRDRGGSDREEGRAPAVARRPAGGGIALPPADGRFERLREEILKESTGADVVEVESPAAEEEWDDEFGRPEGPLDERHVDVYALNEAEARSASWDAPGAPRQGGTEAVMPAADAAQGVVESAPAPRAGFEDDSAAADRGPDEAGGPSAPAAGVRYGRRRGRKPGR